MSTPSPWYSAQGGVHFRCTQCGKCCSRPGFVLVYRDEATNIAPRYRANARPEDLADELWEWDEYFGGWMIEVKEGGHCPFLVDGKCDVHDVKPRQCATYPFWDEIVDKKRTWTQEKVHCEGIHDEGDLYEVDLIDMIKREQRATFENRRR